MVARSHLLRAGPLGEVRHHLVKLCLLHGRLDPPVQVLEVRKLEEGCRAEISPFAIHAIHLWLDARGRGTGGADSGWGDGRWGGMGKREGRRGRLKLPGK